MGEFRFQIRAAFRALGVYAGDLGFSILYGFESGLEGFSSH